MTRTRRLSIVACIAALTAFVGVAAFIVASRFWYPYEIEWTTGGVLDHVERVQRGEPLYVEPSIAWTPYLYPPGYYVVCAWFARLLPLAQACRLVSILSSLAVAGVVFVMGRRLGAGRDLATIGALLWIALFGYNLQWYDIERCDALFVALLAASAAALMSSSRLAWMAGALLGLAFFVKQPATTFLALVPLALFWARGPWIAFLLGELVIAPFFVWQHLASNGWFTYYVTKLPAAHGMETKYITLFFVTDLSRALVLTVATGAALLEGARRLRARAYDPAVAFSAYLLAGFLASASSRLHLGGWPNVLMFWTAFACPAVAWGLSRVEGDRALSAALAAVALQAGAVAPDPNEAIPGKTDARYARAFVERMRELERAGEVVVLGRGHVTERRHAHNNTIIDVMREGRSLPDDFKRGIEAQAYEAIVLDDTSQLDLFDLLRRESGLAPIFCSAYFVAERIDDRAPMPVVGFPTTPRWVMRRRKRPLAGLTREAAFLHMRVEMGMAERNMRIEQATGRHSDGLEIEDEAARELP